MKSLQLLFLTLAITSLHIPGVHAQDRPLNTASPLKSEFSETSKWDPADGTLCVPEYSTGCNMGDGFTDFAVAEIENYGSGCQDLNGTGWSQYLGLGPAVLLPGVTYDFIMQTGYNDQEVTIWVDFNDDYDLTSDEIILLDFDMATAGQFYTVPVEIPSDATPGLHYMRARTNWLGSSSDPCQEYTYGEAEDYYVLIGTAEAGALEGFVTEYGSGEPVENASIMLEGMIDYSTTTGPDGYYLLDYVYVGDYELTCAKPGYNPQETMVTIEDEITLTQNFSLTHPTINVEPLVISKTLAVGGSAEETVTVSNDGNGPLNWAASIQLAGEKDKGFLDLQFQYPAAQGGGEAGIESDGFHIYTTKWNGGEILQYGPDGTFLGAFSIDGVSGLRDLAYDGTHFYGSAAIPVVWEMDFATHELVSTFTAPTSVRAIAYDDNEDVFYANNYSTDVYKFDKAGNALGSFQTGPLGENYYGFAYDAATPGGPFLWGYAQSGGSMNTIVQIQLPAGMETGFTLDVESKLSGPVFNTAGGLYTHPNLVFGKWTLGGLVQNEWIWGLELADAQTWLMVSPNAGTLEAGNEETLILSFDAGDLEPGEYMAEVLFTSWPEVGNPVIEVNLLVSESAWFPCELDHAVNCTDAELTWEVCPPGSPDADSFYIYRDEALLGVAYDMTYTDHLLWPEMPYLYTVTAFFGGFESSPSADLSVMVPMPAGLEPANLSAYITGSTLELTCDPPPGCLTPDSYNLYRDGQLIANSPQGQFSTAWGNYEFYVTAIYYFGESGPSNTVVITGIGDPGTASTRIFPNPVRDKLHLESPSPITRVRILDGSGIARMETMSAGRRLVVDLGDLPGGIYLLEVRTGNETLIRKIVKH